MQRPSPSAWGYPHHVLDLQQTFDRNVVERFMNAYQEGLTPNPCIICNRHIKFGALLDAALDMGCDYIATGHYAKTSQAADGTWQLHRGEDPKKDQSYFCIRSRRSAWRTRSFRWQA